MVKVATTASILKQEAFSSSRLVLIPQIRPATECASTTFSPVLQKGPSAVLRPHTFAVEDMVTGLAMAATLPLASCGSSSSLEPQLRSSLQGLPLRHGGMLPCKALSGRSRRGFTGAYARIATASTGLKEALQYRKLGDSDLVISEVTLGTMTFGNQNTEKEAHEQLSYSFDNGINIFDTAEMYPVPVNPELSGTTDKYISTWLKTQPRDKVIVATKVSGYLTTPSKLRSWGSPLRVDAKNIKESVEGSLKRLQTDYIDLLQIHWPDRYVPLFGSYQYNPQLERESIPFEEQLRALDDVIREGKVRYIGVSNETAYGVMEFAHLAKTAGLPKIVSIQNAYSLIARIRFEVDLVETTRKTNVGLLAYSPLAGGVLSGKYRDLESEAAKKGRLQLFPGYMGRFLKSLAKEASEKYADLAAAHGMTPSQLALAFVRDQSFVTSTIIGATSLDQLKEDLVAWTMARPLSEEINKEINEIFVCYRDPSTV